MWPASSSEMNTSGGLERWPAQKTPRVPEEFFVQATAPTPQRYLLICQEKMQINTRHYGGVRISRHSVNVITQCVTVVFSNSSLSSSSSSISDKL